MFNRYINDTDIFSDNVEDKFSNLEKTFEENLKKIEIEYDSKTDFYGSDFDLDV